MALSKLEKAMGTYILGFTPAGRKAMQIAFVAAVKGGEMAGRAALPVAARALPPVARALAYPPVGVPLAVGAAGYGAQQYFEESGIQEDVNVARDQALAFIAEEGPKRSRRVKSAYNKAVSKAMKAVKASTKGGPKGALTNAKKTFGQVSKAVSKARKGGKLSAKGVTGVIKRSITGIFKKPVAKPKKKAPRKFYRGR
jgi:hypothetical protein